MKTGPRWALWQRKEQEMDKIQVVAGDITKVHADAIVNAANERMLGGGGVDGAIHRAAGYHLLEACRRIPEVRPGVRCPTGSARITEGFELPANYVIHAVGPIWRGGDQGEEELLASCYREIFLLAGQYELRSVALPAISCGVYHFPPERAARIAVAACAQALRSNPAFERLLLVAFGQEMFDILQGVLDEHGAL